MSFFRYKKRIYPLIAVASGLFVIVFGLATAKTAACSYFLLGAFVWFAVFGCYKTCFRILPVFLVVGGTFFGVFYAAKGEWLSALSMANRFGAVFLAIVPGMSAEPAAMTRSLSQVRMPRSVTLGMLISMSFMPLLSEEVRRVREAMKTRGAGSILNAKILYRAFLVPLVMRLVDISDTLALSVETRGFALGRVPYTIYKRESITVSDAVFTAGLITGAVLTVIL
jgi:ABC-type cobalt transport system, permease component CbiQ and related transporters